MDTNYSHLMDNPSHPTQKPMDIRSSAQKSMRTDQPPLGTSTEYYNKAGATTPGTQAVVGAGVY